MKTPEINKAFECLDKMRFFMGQRAGRELWMDKPYDVQERDIEHFNRDIETVRDCIHRLEAHMPKWISVDERLPEDGHRVVAICENGMTGIMDYKDDGTPFAARILGHYFSNITHWMPLPEQPKE